MAQARVGHAVILSKGVSMVDFVWADGGRGYYYKGSAHDCGCRAICIMLGLGYQQVYDDLFKMTGKQPCNGLARKHLTKFIEPYGWRWHALSGVGLPVIRVKDVAKLYPNSIMRLAKHYSSMRDGVNIDTRPQHEDKRVYGVWIREDDLASGPDVSVKINVDPKYQRMKTQPFPTMDAVVDYYMDVICASRLIKRIKVSPEFVNHMKRSHPDWPAEGCATLCGHPVTEVDDLPVHCEVIR